MRSLVYVRSFLLHHGLGQTSPEKDLSLLGVFQRRKSPCFTSPAKEPRQPLRSDLPPAPQSPDAFGSCSARAGMRQSTR